MVNEDYLVVTGGGFKLIRATDTPKDRRVAGVQGFIQRVLEQARRESAQGIARPDVGYSSEGNKLTLDCVEEVRGYENYTGRHHNPSRIDITENSSDIGRVLMSDPEPEVVAQIFALNQERAGKNAEELRKVEEEKARREQRIFDAAKGIIDLLG